MPEICLTLCTGAPFAWLACSLTFGIRDTFLWYKHLAWGRYQWSLWCSMLYKSGSHSHKAAQDQKPSHLPLFPTAKLAREMRTASTHKQRPLCLKKIKLAFRLDLPFLSISSFQSSGQAWLAAHSCGSSSFLLDLAIQEKWIERMRLSRINTNQNKLLCLRPNT